MNASSMSTRRQQLDAYVSSTYPRHPFEHGIDRRNMEPLLLAYFAMSQAFPHLQSSAQRDGIFEAIANNVDLEPAYEITSVVGNFLSWDETGGHACVLGQGNAGLPEVVRTRSQFHANILRSDLALILGRDDVAPSYGPETRSYLMKLHDGLASPDAVRRCATMVAFELHAARMIDALWGSLSDLTGLPRERLQYFAVHVGGADPAEAYHVEMVSRMIDALVPAEASEHFFACFRKAYDDNVNWCESIKAAPREAATAHGSGEEVWHKGSCHCKRISFAVKAPRRLRVLRCHCSICKMTGYLHLTVPRSRVELGVSADVMTTYQFNTNTARHTFCPQCGVKPFYTPRSHPGSLSVNARCLDESLIEGMTITEFDGAHWEESIGRLYRALPNDLAAAPRG